MPRNRQRRLRSLSPIQLDDRILPSASSLLAFGTGPGGKPLVNVIDAATGARVNSFYAFDPAFDGGVRVAMGDFTGDGVADIVAAAGPGGVPAVTLIDGRTNERLSSFFAYEKSFRGGSNVAVGDVTGDGKLDIVTAAGEGGAPLVKIFDRYGNLERSFFAFDPVLRGGCSAAVGDVNADRRIDIVAGAGTGGGPNVKTFDGAFGTLLLDLMPFDRAFRGGVTVAAADLDGDGRADVIAGAGPGGGPHARVLDSLNGIATGEFFAYDPGFRGGLCVTAAESSGRVQAAAQSAESSTVRPSRPNSTRWRTTPASPVVSMSQGRCAELSPRRTETPYSRGTP